MAPDTGGSAPQAGGDEAAGTARRVADAITAFPDVVALSSGAFGTIATPVAGGRVSGVAVRGDGVEIGVVVRYGRPIPEIAAEIRDGVAPLVSGRGIHVSVEDVVAGFGSEQRTRGAGGSGTR